MVTSGQRMLFVWLGLHLVKCGIVCTSHQFTHQSSVMSFSWSLNVILCVLCFYFDISGPLKIEILNKKGESMSRMPTVRQIVIKLSVKLKIVQHGKIISVTKETVV